MIFGNIDIIFAGTACTMISNKDKDGVTEPGLAFYFL